ncbi:thioredoxin [Culicoidibacter larvae]|uniref:Thioredoxin n=1 Tax=Culicoidibacter larvae TaxID=2579976 RepID=A0A5R8QHJ6_9FIRM|nr:thioredoxin [Culicoidibacter larvae]TLG76737.1 thioredoxin [Culicoidibacter larvae]
MAVHVIETKEQFEDKIKSGKYLVDFYATWCGPCQMLLPVLDEIAPQLEADNVEILKINVDELQDVAGEYGVMSVPTLFVVNNGETVAQDAGFKPGDTLVEWVKAN